MTTIVLPALRSDDPIGVIVALGVVELCTSELGMSTALSWNGLGGEARLQTEIGAVDELADLLAGIAKEWSGTGRLAPPSDPRFVTAPLDTKTRTALHEASGGVKAPLDPMRMSRADAAARFVRQRDDELSGDRTGARWLGGLVNQLGMERQEDRCELTPLYARTGQQNLHQLYEHYRDEVARRPERIREALVAWRRVEGDSGANLDARALRDAAAATTPKPGGKSTNAAVPGATWLALMAVPFFRQVAKGRAPLAVGWKRVGRGGRPRRFVWPVWEQFLDRQAIEVLLSHPDVARIATSESRDPKDKKEREIRRRAEDNLAALGVVAICSAERRSLGNSDGPLRWPTVRWTARTSAPG